MVDVSQPPGLIQGGGCAGWTRLFESCQSIGWKKFLPSRICVVAQHTTVQIVTSLTLPALPAAATEDNDEDDEDEESPGSHSDDDGHLLRVWTLDSSEGESDIPLCHASFIDGHTGVVPQITVVRSRDGETE